MDIGFLGAAGTVTGSKFLVHSENTRILVDCGMFQGLKELRLLNWQGFPFDPKDIDAIVLTHGHLDHSGAIPLMVKKGFKGPIYCTEPTADLSRIILLDSAKIQEEDAEYANKKRFSKHDPALPLYTVEDVEKLLPLFKTKPLHESFRIGSLEITLTGAGHILGASSALISNGQKKVLFSGDLGRTTDPLMWPPEPPPECDFIVMESTYGERTHSPISSKKMLSDTIKEVVKNRGVLLIPSFSVGRAQNLIYEISLLKDEGIIPTGVPIYLNTPMGHEVSKLYEKYAQFHRLGPGQFAEIMAGIHIVETADESKELNLQDGPMIIIAASGMLTGGRVLHHLKAFADNPKNVLLLAGFQSPGTRGWKLLNGEPQVKVHGMMIDVLMKIIPSDSFSAHGDKVDLINWLKTAIQRPEKVFLVHGEPSSSEALKLTIQKDLGIDVHIAEMNQFVSV